MKDGVVPVALGAALVVAAIDVPLSARYPLATPIPTAQRVAVTAAMTFAAVLVAGYALKSWEQQ